MNKISLFVSAVGLFLLAAVGDGAPAPLRLKDGQLERDAVSVLKAPIPSASRKPADSPIHKPSHTINGVRKVQPVHASRQRLSPPERLINKGLKLEKDAAVLQNVVVPLFEGDIAGVRQPSETVNALQSRLKSGVLDANRWPQGFVYYVVDPYFTEEEQQVIVDAMDNFYYNVEGLQFAERYDEPDYIYVLRGEVGTGCWSYVGRQGGQQTVNLEPGCVYLNTVIHELNHAIGFWHEQSRSDRDKYVTINWDNIPEDRQHNFQSYDTSETTHFNHPYDFGSVMHYEWNAFAADPDTWTVLPIYPMSDQHSIGEWYGLSPMDVQDLNQLYRVCGTVYTDTPQTDDGSSTWFMNGDALDLHAFWWDDISYVVLKQGCRMHMYRYTGFEGYLGVLTALAATSLDSSGETVVYGHFNLAGSGWDNDARSLWCECS